MADEQSGKLPTICEKYLEKRIEAVHDTVKQARSALLLCILASGAMLLCLWNTYASWDRDFAFLDDEDFIGIHPDRKDCSIPKACEIREEFTDEQQVKAAMDTGWKPSRTQIRAAWRNHVQSRPSSLHDHQMHSWVDTQVVSIALLGIKISVSDFAIVGSLALGICSLYLLLCVRRENHEIGYLFRDIFGDGKEDAQNENVKKHGYHAYTMVTSYMVFNLAGRHGNDGVISTVDKETNKGNRGRTIWGIRFASGLLDFLPALTILLTILCDFGWTRWTDQLTQLFGHVFLLSPFRAHHPDSVYSAFEGPERIYFWCAEIVAFIAVIVLGLMSYKVNNFDMGTTQLLEEVSTRLVSAGIIQPRWPNDDSSQQPENISAKDPCKKPAATTEIPKQDELSGSDH